MGKISWDDVGKEEGGGSSRGLFLSLKDGESATFRVLDESPELRKFHQVSATDGQGKKVFRSIMQTEEVDEDYIDLNTNRFPAQVRYALHVLAYAEDSEDGEIKVLIGGKMIFDAIKSIYKKFGDPRDFDLTLSRDGTGMDTSWAVTAAPKSHEIDIEDYTDKLDEDSAYEWDSIFPPITADQQKAIIDEAGIDITYDPIAEIAEGLTMKKALVTRFSFGKYGPKEMPPNGKTIGQVWKIDQGYIMWIAGNATKGDEAVIAACRFVVDNTGAVEKGDSIEKAMIAPPKAEKEAPPPVDESDDEDITREDWEEAGYSKTPETYLKRWYGKGGNDEKIALAVAILKSEDLVWDADGRVAVDASEADEEEDDDFEEEDDAEETEYDIDGMDVDELRSAIQVETADLDPTEAIALVKKFGKGQAKLRKLDEKQLRKLLSHLI